MANHVSTHRWKYYVAAVPVLTVVALTLKIQSLRHESRTRMCNAHINEVSHSIHVYNAEYGYLPPAVVYEGGVAMHSWRVLILQVLRPDLFAQYRLSEPWNSPHNSLLSSQMPHQYRCGFADSSIPQDHTTYVAVVGSDTVMRTGEESPRRIEDVPKDAIVLVELPNKPRHWMAPDDASPEEISAYFATPAPGSNGHEHYVRADGLVRHVRKLPAKEFAERLAAK